MARRATSLGPKPSLFVFFCLFLCFFVSFPFFVFNRKALFLSNDSRISSEGCSGWVDSEVVGLSCR